MNREMFSLTLIVTGFLHTPIVIVIMGFSRILSRRLLTLTKLSSSSPFKTSHSLSSFFLSSTNSCLNLTLPNLELIYRSIHGPSIKTQLSQKTEEDTMPNIPEQIIKDSEIICKLLLALPKDSSIESILANSGVGEVTVTPMLVLEVLKKLSNSGVLALGFFRWAENQKGFKHTNDCYNALIDALGKIKQFNMIWVLVDSMKSKGILTKYTFSLIIRRYARARRVEDAIKAFEKMEEIGMTIDLSDFNHFLDVMCKSRQVKAAHQMFDEMKQRRFKPVQKSYTILLEGWGQQRNLLKLDEVYREMKDEGFEPDVVAYGIIMNAYCKSGKVALVVEKFREMVEKGVEPSQHIFCILINGLGSDKRLGEALKFFEMSRANDVVPEAPTYNAVVGSYCWSMRFDDAFRMVDEMRRCRVGPNSRTYDIILHHLIKAGKDEEAYSVFLKMGNDQVCAPTSSTYEIIIRMYCSKGELNMAVKIWNQMKAKGVLPGMHMFATLINSFQHANKLEDACKYFEEMIELGLRPPGSVFSSLKQALFDQGKKDTALLLVKKLDAIRVKPIIY